MSRIEGGNVTYQTYFAYKFWYDNGWESSMEEVKQNDWKEITDEKFSLVTSVTKVDMNNIQKSVKQGIYDYMEKLGNQ